MDKNLIKGLNSKTAIFISILLGITIYQFGCSSSKAPTNPFNIKTTSYSGNVELPNGVNIYYRNLVVSSFIGSAQVKPDGTFDVKAVVGPGNQVLFVTDTTTGNLVLLGYVPSGTTIGISVSAGSTANALIGITPLLIGYSFSERQQILNFAYAQPQYKKLVNDISADLVTDGEKTLDININPQLYTEAGYISYRAINSFQNQITSTAANILAFRNALYPLDTTVSNPNGPSLDISINAGDSSNHIIASNPKAIYYATRITGQNSTQIHLISPKPAYVYGCEYGVFNCQMGPFSTTIDLGNLANGNYAGTLEKGFNFNDMNTLLDPSMANGLATVSNAYWVISQFLSLFGIPLPALTDQNVHDTTQLLNELLQSEMDWGTDQIIDNGKDTLFEAFMNFIKQHPDQIASWLVGTIGNDAATQFLNHAADLVEVYTGVGTVITVLNVGNTIGTTIYDLITASGYMSYTFNISGGTPNIQSQIAKIIVSPSSVSVQVGQTISVLTKAYDSNNIIINDPSINFSWSSDNIWVANACETLGQGNIIGRGVGTTNIAVWGGNVSTTVAVTVTPAPSTTSPPTFGGVSLVTLNSDNSISLTWNPAADASTSTSNIIYLIYESTTVGGENYNSPTYTTSPGVLSYTIPNSAFQPNTKYYFVVRARNSAGITDDNTYELSSDRPPIISSLTANPSSVNTSGTSTLTCNASDPDNDPLTYSWSASQGSISGSGSTVTWTAPSTAGAYIVACTVYDGQGGMASKSVTIAAGIQAPTLTVTPSSGQQGTQFNYGGNGYTPNGTVLWHVKKPDGTEYGVTNLTNNVNGSGSFNFSYLSSCNNEVGTYTIWAIDSSTGLSSNSVTENISASSSCSTTIPTVSSVSPSTMTANGVSQTLTIYGSNFQSGNIVQFYWTQGSGAGVWNNSNSSPTINSSGQITVAMNPGTVNDTISVRVCLSASQTSSADCSSGTQYVTVTAPTSTIPTVSSVSPSMMTANGVSQTLTIYGSNFQSGNIVQFYWTQGSGAYNWNTSNNPPTINSSGQITVTMNPGTVADTIDVRVCLSATQTSSSDCSSGTQYVSVQ